MKNVTKKLGKLPASIITQLGKLPDKAIAEQANVAHHDIFRLRNYLGIPPCFKHSVQHHKKLTTDDFNSIISALGTSPDTRIAKNFNVSREYIRQLRLKHKIGRYQ